MKFKRIKNYFESNEDESITQLNLSNTANMLFREKFEI
jgi:hypothetical protein